MDLPIRPGPPKHVKTGDFSEAFAQEADDRRKADTVTRSGHDNSILENRSSLFSRSRVRDIEGSPHESDGHDVSTNLNAVHLISVHCWLECRKRSAVGCPTHFASRAITNLTTVMDDCSYWESRTKFRLRLRQARNSAGCKKSFNCADIGGKRQHLVNLEIDKQISRSRKCF